MLLNKDSLNQSLAGGKTRETLEKLLACTAADRDLHAEALALSARFQHYLREKNAGRAESAWLETELNRIHATALDLIGRLPDDSSLDTALSYAKTPPRRWWYSATFWGTAIAVAALAVALLSYLNDRGIYPEIEPAPVETPVTNIQKPVEKTAELPPAAPSKVEKSVKNQTNIAVKDKAKVGIINTGDSAKFNNIKQDF